MKKKKLLSKIIIILIILLILSIGGVFGYNYYLESINNERKEKFYSYIFQNNLSKTIEASSIQKILKKLDENSYSSVSNIEFSNTFPIDSNLDIDKLTLEFETSKNDNNNNSLLKFIYSNNELFNLDILSNSKYIGITNNDILKNYIAVNRDNVQAILSKVNPNIGNLYKNSNNFANRFKFKENIDNIFSLNNSEYINLFKKYIKSNEYLDEGSVFIEQNGNKIETQVYSLTITKEELLNLFSVIANQILEDENIMKSIIASENTNHINQNDEFQSNLNFQDIVVEEQSQIHAFRESDASNNEQNNNIQNFSTDTIEENDIVKKFSIIAENLNDSISNTNDYEDIINSIKYICCLTTEIGISENDIEIKNNLNNIFEDLNGILNEKINDNENVKFIVYVSNNKTIKTSILLGSKIECDLEFISNNDKNEETKLTIVEKSEEEYNGYTISISKNKTNVIDNTFIEIDEIKNTQIVGKLELKLTIEGSETSNTFDNTFNILYSGNQGKFSSTITNKLNFKNMEIQSLNSDNTLLLDDLADSDFNFTINKLNYRLENVYNDKLSKMNLINTNTSDTILQNNQEDNNQDNSEEEKEQLINVLVDSISNEMGIAESEEKEYTIQDLKDLNIDGYDIQVSVSQELAIVKINGYTFKIDKDFNLSE